MSDQVVLVDKEDRIIGQTSRKEAHQKSLLHRVSVIYLYNNKGEILIQHRIDGRLDHSSAGHVDPGESYLQAAHRELFEELGVNHVELLEFATDKVDEIKPDGSHPNHQYTIYKVKASPKEINKEEVANVYWANPKDVLLDMEKDPNHVKYTKGFKITLKRFLQNI